MDWKIAAILSLGAVCAALILNGNGAANAAFGGNSMIVQSGIDTWVWHMEGGKVRACHLRGQNVTCTAFR